VASQWPDAALFVGARRGYRKALAWLAHLVVSGQCSL
jgi:hypothetical protein